MTDAIGLLHGADFAQRDVGAAAHEQFRLRWSPRSMSGESLTVAQVQTLCEAGALGPFLFQLPAMALRVRPARYIPVAADVRSADGC